MKNKDESKNTINESKSIKLTDKQKKFVQEYLVDLNGTQACIRSGYSEKTARQIATDLLSKVHIQQALDEAQQKIIKKTKITQERVLEEYAKIAFSDLSEYISFENGKATLKNINDIPKNIRAVIAEIKETKDGLTFKLHSKTDALNSIAKHLGMFIERSQIDINSQMTEDIEKALVNPEIQNMALELFRATHNKNNNEEELEGLH